MTDQPDQLREKRVELILQQLEELPTLPSVAVQVLEVTGRDDATAGEVAKLIAADPSLTVKILQLVRRADAGVRGEVNSVERAIVLLGFEAVRSAVLAVSVFDAFHAKPGQPNGHFHREEFWKHSIAVACCAELLAESTTGVSPVSSHDDKDHGRDARGTKAIDPSEAFVCGLLHDLGKVALDAMLPKSFSRVVEAADLLRTNIADIERSVIGLDHLVVGKRLAERWQLPLIIRDCAWLHGQLPEALPATVKNPRMVNLITLADDIVREQHLGYSGNYTAGVPRMALLDAIGLTPQQLTEATVKLVEQIETRAAALGLGKSTSVEIYQQALTRANKELGRVSEQLSSKSRRLAVRAKFFDALAGFQGELRPDASPQAVLQAIGQTAVAVLDVTSAAAFSLIPGKSFAEVLLFDNAGDVFENTLVDCTTRPERPPGDGPILSAGQELEWLLAAISPRLGSDRRYWICLEADGVCVGGVVWGARAGESQRLSNQVQELTAIAAGWGLALRTAQIRDEAQTLAEQLAEANRQLQAAHNEVLRSKMMVSVGEMAAGAAHEMNNPLAVISGRSQLLSSQLSDAKLIIAAKVIHEQADRLSQIISELMDFAKPVPPKRGSADVAELVERALHEAKMQTEPADRSIEVTMGGDLPDVNVDAQQVSAALIEIIDNALLASDAAKGQIQIHGAFDRYSMQVVITIADNGVGMDEHTLKRAFDPFFSSKSAGRRRGMGLAKALRWVESSGGSIRLESRPGHGTRSIVLLPAMATQSGEQGELRPPRHAAQ